MGNAIFPGLLAPKHLGRFSKKLQVWLRRELHPTRKFWGQSVKGGVSAHAWNCHPQASIFSFLGFMLIATGRPVGLKVTVSGSNDALRWPLRPFYGFCSSLQVGPLDWRSPLAAQMTRSGGHYVLFMVSLIKKYFSVFVPKNVKNCITPYRNFEQL